jgi:hypothetical protein
MHFENDIFISYAHIDNEALGADQEGWVSDLHRWLDVRLGQLAGAKPRIWRDPKLQGNDYFADEIVERFPSVATLICVLSPRYVRSEWCMRELHAFLDATAAHGGFRVGGKSRLFKVVKTPVPLESQPDELRGLLGYEFYAVDEASQRVREFNQLGGPELERQYWATLDDLAQDLSQILGSLEHPQQPASEPDGPPPATVYLAETTHDLKPERDALRRDLLQHGYRLLPEQALPLIEPELSEAIGAGLADSRLSVHPIGSRYGIVPEGASRSIVDLQNELALEACESGSLTRLVWIPPAVAAADERQQAFLTTVGSEQRGQHATDLLRTDIEALKEAVHHRLRPRPEPEPSPADAAEGEELNRVYLVCDQRDLETIAEVEDFLYDRGLEVILPVFEGDEAAIRLDHQENLRMCESVLLYYGQVHELWLREKLRELLKISGYGRSAPMRAKAIYVAGPSSPSKERLRTRGAMIIRGIEGFSAELLDPFVRLTEGRATP